MLLHRFAKYMKLSCRGTWNLPLILMASLHSRKLMKPWTWMSLKSPIASFSTYSQLSWWTWKTVSRTWCKISPPGRQPSLKLRDKFVVWITDLPRWSHSKKNLISMLYKGKKKSQLPILSNSSSRIKWISWRNVRRQLNAKTYAKRWEEFSRIRNRSWSTITNLKSLVRHLITSQTLAQRLRIWAWTK